MPTDFPTIGMPSAPYGHPDDFSIYINETEYSGFIYLHPIMKINQLESFEARIMDVTSSDTNVRYGKIIKIFAENNLLLKGKITETKYQTDGSATIKGFGMGILLANAEYADRTSSTNLTQNHVKKILSFNNDSTSPFIINYGTLQEWEGGGVIFRTEYDNKLQALGSLATQLEWDWWISNGDAPYNNDVFNFAEWRGSLAPTYSVALSGTSQNAIISERNDNFDKLINSVIYLGKKEGTNQLNTKISFASAIYDRLDQTYNTDGGVIVLITAKNFPVAGIANIGRLYFSWISGGLTGNFFNGANIDTEGGTDPDGQNTGGAVDEIHYKGTLCTLVYDATGKQYTLLDGEMTSSQTTIVVDSTSGFTSTGSIIIGKEVISYTGTTATTFTGCSRASNASIHDDNQYVFQYDSTKYYIDSSPQSGSSIAENGLKQITITDPSKQAERQLEMETSNYLLRNGTITYEITFELMDYFDFFKKVKLGDRVQIIDSDTGLNDIYRVLGIDMTWDMGAVKLLITASNKKITESTFMDSIADINRTLQRRLTYAQS